MNILSRTLSGGILVVVGLILIIISPFVMFVTLIYGIPLLLIGLFILFNKKEDEIEKIKSKSKGGKK
jgi:membrane-bound ClpP family serine protease